ncbi:TonB-dependent receptor [Flavobacterium sp. MDT1-60]|uniref:TonB-dependent receptor n=1 Tax=Flavobacterium sp. MDT1-60 TaxID=1979344 RepID=UPI001CE0DC3E|nr:TonB-dependent receptor [Flavobacterium sp. MDT1-60]
MKVLLQLIFDFIKSSNKKIADLPETSALVLLMFLLFNAGSIQAQALSTGSISGSVITNDGNASQGVIVKLIEANKNAVTNSAGNFEFKKVPFGKYTLEVTMSGYESSTETVEITEQNPSVSIDIKVNSSVQNLEDVVIRTGGNRFAKKESFDVAKMPLKNIENSQVYIVVSKELMKEQVVTDYNSAFKNVPGAGIAEVRNQGRTTSISRGFPTPQVVRNGVGSFTYTTIDPSNLERIEVIKGPSATLFGSTLSSFGGLFNRVTKKPFDTFKGEVSYSAASWDLNRLTFDINTPLTKTKQLCLESTRLCTVKEAFRMQDSIKTFQLRQVSPMKSMID